MLPDWIDLPAPRPFAEIRYAPDIDEPERSVYFAWDGEQVVGATFDFYELYTEVDRNYNLEISDLARQAAGLRGILGSNMYSMPSPDGGNARAIIVLSDMDCWNILQDDYHGAVAKILEYRSSPNIDTAFEMLNSHPAFWVKSVSEPTFDWITDRLAESFSYFRYDGGWCIEAGGHTDDLQKHFLDYELITYGETFEDCILELAEKVNKKFNIDGTRRGEL